MDNREPTPSYPPARQGGCISLVVLGLVWLWIILVTFGRNLTPMSFGVAIPLQEPFWLQAASPFIEALLLAIPLAPLAWLWGNPRLRGVYQTWLAMAGFVLVMFPIFLLKPYESQVQALLHIVLSLIFAGIIRFIGQGRITRQGKVSRRGAVLAALAIAGLFAIPWLAWGAFGSFLDILLQLGAALSFGIAAAVAFDVFLFPTLQRTSTGATRDFLLGGFAAGTTLAILASGTGFGFGVMQILLILCISPLGFAAMGLSARRRADQTPFVQSDDIPSQMISLARPSRLAGALLLGLAFAAPMTLIDPDELALIISISPGEILQWALYACLASAGVAWLLSLVTFIVVLQRRRQAAQGTSRRSGPAITLLAAGALAAWIIAFLVYFSIGRPGFYGEGIFVILKDQANVSDAAQRTKSYNDRRQYVYQTLVQHADTTQAGLRADLDRFHIAYRPYYLENAIQVQAGPLVRLWMETRPEVDRVLDNPWMRPLPQTPPVQSGSQPAPTSSPWNLRLIGADRVWYDLHVTGKGIVVGQSDTGVQWDHPNLKDNYRGFDKASGKVNNDYNWLDPWTGKNSPFDIEGHGTHTLGTIVGKYTGVAPDATWYACINLERNLGNPSVYLNCMQFMLAPYPLHGDPFKDGDPSKGAMVINNSWGCPDMEGCDANALLPAVEALTDAGVFVVVSAGNDGPACETLKDPPAIYQQVFSVGAIDSTRSLVFFSSLGPVTADGSGRIKPDIVAPGAGVLSSMPENTYAFLDGTSMAGPHVVGVVALMWSANPALIGDIPHTTQILAQTAQKYVGPRPDCPKANDTPSSDVGYGIVDAYAAVEAALQFSK